MAGFVLGDSMSWQNILKGQEPKDDPRIQGFLEREKPEYHPNQKNINLSIKRWNTARMELAEKMLEQDGYIDMMRFFDVNGPSESIHYDSSLAMLASAYHRHHPMFGPWITKDMFTEGEDSDNYWDFREMHGQILDKVPSIIKYGMHQTILTWDAQGNRIVEKLTDEEVSYKNKNLMSKLKEYIIEIEPPLDNRKLLELMVSDEDPTPKLEDMANKLKVEAKSQFEQNYPDELKRISFEEFLDTYEESTKTWTWDEEGIGKLKESFDVDVEQFDSNAELLPLKKNSPFHFRGWLWQKVPKNKKLEMFRELLPSETEGGTLKPVSSTAKPTYAEEEMMGRDVFDNKDDPRKRPINSDSGTFPMGFARKPFGSDVNVKKTWQRILMESKMK